jgi:hypothetical protein
VHGERGVVRQHAQPRALARAEGLVGRVARHRQHAERLAVGTQRRDEHRPEGELGDDAHQRASRVAEVLLVDDVRESERLLEHRALELEAASTRRNEMADRRDHLAELARHPQHRRATAMALPRRDLAQRAQHLGHVHHESEASRDVAQRHAVVVDIAARLEHQPRAEPSHRADDRPRRGVGVRRLERELDVPGLAVRQRRPELDE